MKGATAIMATMMGTTVAANSIARDQLNDQTSFARERISGLADKLGGKLEKIDAQG
jgi:hypothetical protein